MVEEFIGKEKDHIRFSQMIDRGYLKIQEIHGWKHNETIVALTL